MYLEELRLVFIEYNEWRIGRGLIGGLTGVSPKAASAIIKRSRTS